MRDFTEVVLPHPLFVPEQEIGFEELKPIDQQLRCNINLARPLEEGIPFTACVLFMSILASYMH